MEIKLILQGRNRSRLKGTRVGKERKSSFLRLSLFLPRKLCTGKELEVTGAGVNTESIKQGDVQGPCKVPKPAFV